MKQRPLRARARSAGYTLVELMMALALFTVALLGIISLQKLMIVSNAHAKNMATAERIARSWAAQLQLDSTRWRQDLNEVNWLDAVDDGWTRPGFIGDDLNFGAGFDALGNPVTDDNARASYCTNVRLTWLYPPNVPVSGNGMMRAEIRVFWLREGQANLNAAGICRSDVSPADIDGATDRYHFVYQTVGIRQHASI